MRLSATTCKAIPADSGPAQASYCPYRAGVASPFCREHAEELSALKERERAAAHDAALFRKNVDYMLADSEGVQAYLRVREVRKDERIVQQYVEALERQVGAAVALKTRFFSDAEDRDSEGPAVLEERKASIEAFLAALQARANAIERELELKLERERGQEQEQEREVAASPLENPAPELPALAPSPVPVPVPVPASELEREREQEEEEEREAAASPSDNPAPELPPSAPCPVPVPGPSSVPAPDAEAGEPPAYPILDVPHPPCACTADSSDTRPEPRGPPGRCTALRVRDGKRCTWTCRSGQRFCVIHCVAHGTVVVSHKVKEGMLEAQRMQLARGAAAGAADNENEKNGNARRIGAVKSYVEKLEEVIGVVEEHQRLFSCRSPESHAAVVQDLKQRRTSAGLLLGKLSGRADAARIAEDQGQAETWATEFLTEVKHKDALERRKAVEDLVTGAIVGGATAWFGVPWARSAVAGVVSSIVVRKARDAHEKS